jgi:hypothetical protein
VAGVAKRETFSSTQPKIESRVPSKHGDTATRCCAVAVGSVRSTVYARMYGNKIIISKDD